MTVKVRPFNVLDVHHVLQVQQLPTFLNSLRAHEGSVVLDLETTGLNEYARTARIVTASFTLPNVPDKYPQTYVVGLSHPDVSMATRWREVITQIVALLKDLGTPIIGQNIRFDVGWLTAHT